MEIKTTVRYYHQGSECPSSKNLQTITAREDAEKVEPPYTAGGSVNGYVIYGEYYGGSLKSSI